jgi:hypothetical protein
MLIHQIGKTKLVETMISHVCNMVCACTHWNSLKSLTQLVIRKLLWTHMKVNVQSL